MSGGHAWKLRREVIAVNVRTAPQPRQPRALAALTLNMSNSLEEAVQRPQLKAKYQVPEKTLHNNSKASTELIRAAAVRVPAQEQSLLAGARLGFQKTFSDEGMTSSKLLIQRPPFKNPSFT